MTEEDKLPLYLAIKAEWRESKETILKAHGLNWTGFTNLEREVMPAIPPEGIVVGKYRATRETIETHILPSNAPLGPKKERVMLHEERK